jgi:gluconate kinase
MSYFPEALLNSIPYRLFIEGGEPFCNWLQLADKKFEEPFFDETILKCRALPVNVKNRKCISSLSLLPDWSLAVDSAKPAVFIFHLSRCGSTLVSQLFTLDDTNIVLSEVPFIDEILRLPYQKRGISEEQTTEWLEAAIQFYGQKRNEIQERLIIKTDCWHIFFYQHLRKIYPEVPFVFLYRQPDEILQSQQKRRGMQAVPDMIESSIFGIRQDEIQYADFDHYFSLVMEKIMTAALQLSELDSKTILVNYVEGILPIVERIAFHASIPITSEIQNQMKLRISYHAKYPEQVFSEEKNNQSYPAMLTGCMALYQQLEEKRKADL